MLFYIKGLHKNQGGDYNVTKLEGNKGRKRMKKIAVATDGNSGITPNQANILGIEILPMPFYLNEKLFYENINLTQEEFYLKMEADPNVSTSPPSEEALLKLWNKVLKKSDELVYLPTSSSLGQSYEIAKKLASKYEGRVEVADIRKISVTQRQFLLEALAMARKGFRAAQIRVALEDHRDESFIFMTVETLRYLKKGGKITPAAAALESGINHFPVLQLRSEKADAFAEATEKSQARRIMIKAAKEELQRKYAKPFENKEINLMVAYSGNEEEAYDWKAEVEEEFPGYPIHISPMPLSVACHTGHGALVLACTKKIK